MKKSFSVHRFSVLFLVASVYVLLVCMAIFAVATDVVRGSFSGTATGSAECAIVFGSSVHGKRHPGPGMVRRVGTAVQLYRDDKIDRLIMTGGKGSDWKDSEAQVMAKYAEELGVPSRDIILEQSATSTWENLELTEELTKDCESVIAVSDAYHLKRIEYLAQMQGREGIETYPAMRRSGTGFENRMVLREAAALLYYLFVH